MASKRTTKKGPEQSGPHAVSLIDAEVFQTLCALNNFDIVGFNEWLDRLEPCGAKQELCERRWLALQASRQRPPNEGELFRHLEWMLLRWREIRKGEAMAPLLRTGAKVTAPLRGANAIRHEDAQSDARDWQRRAEDKWSIPRHQNKTASEIARLIAEPGEKWNTIRRRIKKPD